MSDRLTTVVAEVFEMPPEAVTDDLEFGVTPAWDSLHHINLMVSIESAFDLFISDDVIVDLTTVRAIRAYLADQGVATASTDAA